MAKASAGILMYRRSAGIPEFFLVHSGGPFWKKKDMGAWGIPKGNIIDGEEHISAAKREFMEETGIILPENPFLVQLSPIKQKSGKTIHIWAYEAKNNESFVKSIDFEMEWPPRSGRKINFPEIDRGGFFPATEAKNKIIAGQFAVIEELLAML